MMSKLLDPSIICAKPSIQYCNTGVLEEGEKYNQFAHIHGKTPIERRCDKHYPQCFDYKNAVGGKSRKPRRKSIKSRKPRRKSIKSRKNRRK